MLDSCCISSRRTWSSSRPRSITCRFRSSPSSFQTAFSWWPISCWHCILEGLSGYQLRVSLVFGLCLPLFSTSLLAGSTLAVGTVSHRSNTWIDCLDAGCKVQGMDRRRKMDAYQPNALLMARLRCCKSNGHLQPADSKHSQAESHCNQPAKIMPRTQHPEHHQI